MKTLLTLIALVALTFTARAQVGVCLVDGWASGPDGSDWFHDTPVASAASVSFRPYPDQSGVVKLRFHGWAGPYFWMPAARQVDYLIVEFASRNYDSRPIAYAYRWAGGWDIDAIHTPTWIDWVAIEIDVRDGVQSMRLASYGWGWAPVSFEWYANLLPPL